MRSRKRQSASLLHRAARALLVLAPKRVAGALALLLLGLAVLLVQTCRAQEPATFCNLRSTPELPAGPVEWSFLFLDEDPEKLAGVRVELERAGFQFRCYECGPCWPCCTTQLHMVRTEEHDLATHRARDAAMCEVAKTHKIETYWAMTPNSSRVRPCTRPPPD